jgi:hypothetical protein
MPPTFITRPSMIFDEDADEDEMDENGLVRSKDVAYPAFMYK